MPGIGKTNAAVTARSVTTIFKNISLVFVAGICGGAPRTYDGHNVFLDDVIASTQVLQTDFRCEYENGFVMKGSEEGNLGPAPKSIGTFLNMLQEPRAQNELRARIKRL